MQRLLESPRRQRFYLLLASLLLAVFTAQCVHVARLYSVNWDEAHHLYDGYRILTERDYRANAEVPPLVKVTAALPLLALHPVLPVPAGTGQTEDAFLSGRRFVFGNGGDRLLFPARMVCMLFSLATAALIFVVARHLFGSVAGVCALGLFTFDPTVLAHGTLISTDMASACFLFAAVYAFLRCVEQPGWRWLLATGCLSGCALSAKFTGILIAPMLILLAVAEGLRAGRPGRIWRLLLAAGGALACAWAVVWMFYGFRYAPAPGGLPLQPAPAEYFASMPNPAQGAKLLWMARHHLLPEAYLWGLSNTKHTEWEYTSYFFGRIYRHGPWQYFPAAFLIKSTLPLLLLLLVAMVRWLRGGQRLSRKVLFLLVPVMVYSGVVVTSHFDIGVRHLLPVYPFLYVIAGAAAASLLRMGRGWAAVAAALLVWQAVTTVRVAPSYMAYGNEAWGGPLAVRRYLSDANVDWGQQLNTVRQYLDRNGSPECWFAYFPDGAVEPRDYGIHCHRLPTPSGLFWFGLPMEVPPVIHGTVLISESDLDGVESGDGPTNPYEDFRHRKPDAILQDGVYVYRGDFPVPLAAAWVAVRDSGTAMGRQDMAGALLLAQQAVEWAPGATRTQVQLATVLAKLGRVDEARQHYLLAKADLKRDRPDLQGDEFTPQIENGLRSLLRP